MIDNHAILGHAFAHQEECQFKLAAKRNKLLGLWAAQLLGKTGIAAEAYAREVIMVDLEEPGDDDVIRKLHVDLVAGGVLVTEEDIKVKLHEMAVVAANSVGIGTPTS